MRKQCIICNLEDTRVIYRLRDIQVLTCNLCGLTFVDESMSNDEISQLYETEDYNKKHFSFYLEGMEEKITNDYLNEFKFIDKKKPSGGLIFDFGCGSGEFLSKIDSKWSKSGIDVSLKAIEKGRAKYGYDLIAEGIEKANLPDGKFDIVTMWMVIEHLQNPFAVLKEVQRILKDDGVVVIKTPNKDSLLAIIADSLYKVSLGKITYPISLFYTPLHIYYFDFKGLTMLLQKTNFKIIKVAQDERYVTKYALSRFTLLQRMLLKTISIISKILERQDSITVYAEKVQGIH